MIEPKIINPAPFDFEGVTYDEYFIWSLTIGSPNEFGSQVVNATLRPYNASSGIYPNTDKDDALIISSDLAESERSSFFKFVMDSIENLANQMVLETYLKSQLTNNPNDINLQNQLKIVEANLGVNN